MSCFNSALYLNEAVDSMLNQSFTDFEFLIVNDGSTDETFNILNEYNDNRIHIINQENQGLARSLNNAIKLANGEYLVRMDADDISFPNRLENQFKFMESNPNIGVYGTAVSYISENGKLLGRSFPYLNNKVIKQKILGFKGNVVAHPTVIIRKKTFNKYGPYNEFMSFNQDYHLWSKFLRNGVLFENTNEIELKYRISKNSIGSTIIHNAQSREILHKVVSMDYPSKELVNKLTASVIKNKSKMTKDNFFNYEMLFHKLIKYFIGENYSTKVISCIKNFF